MKCLKKCFWVLLCIIFLINTESYSQVVYDIDGNEYRTVVIGDQVWLRDNLKVSQFKDGTAITLNSRNDDTQWTGANTGETPLRASYLDNSNISDNYGYLYNWYVVNKSNGICPEGWRVPSNDEFKTLERVAGMPESEINNTNSTRGIDENIGGILRDSTSTGDFPNLRTDEETNNTDSLGFSWYGSGYKYHLTGAYDDFDLHRDYTALWVSTEASSTNAYRRGSVSKINNFPNGFNVTSVQNVSTDKRVGISIRCLTDATVQLDNSAGFRMLTSPVDTNYAMFLDQIWTQGMSNADSDQGDPNVWTWDTNTGAWSAVSDLDTELIAGTAILVYIFNDRDYDGTPNTSAPSLYIGGSLGTGDVTPIINPSASGFTLLGNPYNKEIDIDNVSKSNLASTIYIWDPTANSGSGEWEEWNGSSGDISGGVVPAFQGFFVQTTSGTPSLTFDYSNDTTATSGSYYGKVNVAESSNIRLLLSGEGMASSMWLQIDEQGSLNEVLDRDARKLRSLNSDYAQLATSKAGELLSIAVLPKTDDEYTIPVSIDVTKSGDFTLMATDFNIPDGYKLTFNDNVNNESIEIKNDFSYQMKLNQSIQKQAVKSPLEMVAGDFNIQATATNTDDYTITVQKVASLSNEGDVEAPSKLNLWQNYPNPFNPTTEISFDLPNEGNVRLVVYDMLGRKIAVLVDEVRKVGNYKLTFDASGLSSGIYIYRLETGNQILTQRMTLIK